MQFNLYIVYTPSLFWFISFILTYMNAESEEWGSKQCWLLMTNLSSLSSTLALAELAIQRCDVIDHNKIVRWKNI